MFAPIPLERIGAAAMELALRGSVLLLVTALAVLLLRRSSAAARALVWRFALVGLAILPVLCFVVPPVPIAFPAVEVFLAMRRLEPPPPLPRKYTAFASAPRFTDESTPAIPMKAGGNSALSVSRPLPPAPQPLQRAARAQGFELLRRTVLAAMLAAWLLGALALTGRWAAGLCALRRLARGSAEASERLAVAVRSATTECGVMRPISVRVAAAQEPSVSPMTWGHFRPMLLLPATVEAWPEAQLRAVLLHEAAHIRRRDWAARVAANLLCALYWPNPLVWFAARQLRHESELACDDRVLHSGVPAVAYAAYLLEIVRMRKNTDSLPDAAIAMADRSRFETRIRAALDPSRQRRPLSAGARVLIAASLGLLLAVTGLVRLATRAQAEPRSYPAETSTEAALPTPKLPENAMPGGILRTSANFSAAPAVPSEPPASAPHIAWGAAVRGLQVGIERTDDSRTVIFGQRVSLRLWMRNMGTRSLAVRYAIALSEESQNNRFLWDILTQNGSRITAIRRIQANRDHTAVSVTLKPGEEKPFPMPELSFVARTMGSTAVVEQTAVVTPGRCTLQVFPFTVASAKDSWMRAIGTGVLYLDVAPAVESTTLRHSAARKPAAPPANALDDMDWGQAADGLQAGIRIPGVRRSFKPGDRVTPECAIKNVTDRPISFSYAIRMYHDDLPIIRSLAAPATAGRVVGVSLRGIDPAFLVTLKPHETLLVNHHGFVLGDKPLPLPKTTRVPKGLEQYPNLAEPDAGQYTVQQPIMYALSTAAEVARLLARSHAADRVIIEPFLIDLVRPDGSHYDSEAVTIPYFHEYSSLLTGLVDFRIRGVNEPDPIRAVGEAVDEEIAWGAVSGGLQAGLRAHDGRNAYPLGSTVAMEYVIRNVSRTRIAFEHDVFPGVAGIIPDVLDGNGKPAYTFGLPTGQTMEMKQRSLQPGEIAVIGQTAMGLGGNGSPWYSSRPGSISIRPTAGKALTYMDSPPGQYRIRSLNTIFPRQGTRKLVLYTGYLPLKVFDPVSWGKPHNGLQAGISLPPDRIRYMDGETVELNYLVLNVSSNDISFEHSVWPPYSYSPIVVVGPNGKRWSVALPGVRGVQRTQTKMDTLRPGESILVGRPRFTLGAARSSSATGIWDGAGVYHVTQSLGDLESGILEVEVESPRAPGSIGNVF